MKKLTQIVAVVILLNFIAVEKSNAQLCATSVDTNSTNPNAITAVNMDLMIHWSTVGAVFTAPADSVHEFIAVTNLTAGTPTEFFVITHTTTPGDTLRSIPFLVTGRIPTHVYSIVPTMRVYQVGNPTYCIQNGNALIVQMECMPPTAAVTPNVTICSGQSATLTASGGNTFLWLVIGASTPTVLVNPLVTTTYIVLVSDSTTTCGWDSASVTVTVNPSPVITAGNNVTICGAGFGMLSATGAGVGGSYFWSPSIGLNNANVQNPTAFVQVTTTFTVVGTNINGCSASASVTITVSGPPVVIVTPPVSICFGNSTTLNAGGASTYVWSPATGLSSTIGQSVTANPTITRTYTVTGTLNGCTGTAQVTVTVNPVPSVTVSPNNVSICSGQGTPLVASGANTYIWSPPTGLSSTTGSSVFANPISTITYTVTGTTNGCNSAAQVTVTVNTGPIATSATGNLLITGTFICPISHCVIPTWGTFWPTGQSVSFVTFNVPPGYIDIGEVITLVDDCGCSTWIAYSGSVDIEEIANVTKKKGEDKRIFNLLGQEVTGPLLPNTIYIQGGKKIMRFEK